MGNDTSIIRVGSKTKKLARRRSSRVEQAAYARIEALERRVLMSITITVQTNGDGSSDSVTGSGGTYTAQTLREAVDFADTVSANSLIDFITDLSGGDTITLGASLLLSSSHNATTIQGGTSGGVNVLTVSGDNANTVFQVDSGANAAIRNLDIIDGHAGSGDGGGIFNDGGNLTVSACLISTNTASEGAGIFSSGGLNVIASTISNDTASSYGGGVYNLGTATLTNVTISTDSVGNNEGTYGDDGGGIYNNGDGSLSLTDCTLSGDQTTGDDPAGEYGGGIYNLGAASITGGTLTLCTADKDGGAIFNKGVIGTCTLVTISTCTADRNGGAVMNAGTGSLTSSHCTISGDTADHDGGGIYNHTGTYLSSTNDSVSGCTAITGGGIYTCASAEVTMTGSTLYGNTATDTTGGGSGGGGLFNRGTATLVSCNVDACSAVSDGGGISSTGPSTFTLESSTVLNDTTGGTTVAGFGGGVYISSSDGDISDCTVSGCKASYGGGGV
jgi:hypothetical protein